MMSNHTVAVLAHHEFCITQGALASLKEDAIWDCPMTPQIYSGVTGVVVPGVKKGTSTIFKKDHDMGRVAVTGESLPSAL